ncbi:fibronectin type III domain-containing protein [Candidatus Chloroploca sp. Khr17]|uniref:fibronectin type III domain-containing protein n=1 Tax=Candidatus Chloroploca sp. Khr17 TaxID=2496869 RepID=UPI00101C16FA|nr:fibronectin type III domain-containing protein [Candidatus Chloroploca sp. Khr17]
MKRYHQFRLAMALLVILTLILPSSHPILAQQTEPRILCYQPPETNFPDDCQNLAAAGKLEDPPWSVVIVTGAELSRWDLADFVMFAITRGSASSLEGEITRIREYVSGGGNLLLLDPAFGEQLDPSLAAPRVNTRLNRASELTRAGLFTPIVGEPEAAKNLPPAGFGIVPIATLGEAWIPQTRAGFGALSSTTLASALLDDGRVIMAPTGLTSIDFATTAAKWACCLQIAFGPNMSVTAIEVTQAIQDLNNSVELLAGKRTYVRVHVTSPQARSGVTATLSGRRGATVFASLTPINPGGTITVKPSPNRGLINDSFLFELPASWTNGIGSLELTARLDPANTVLDPVLSNNRRTVTVNLLRGPVMRLRIYNVRYTIGSSTYQASNFHVNALESWLRRAYPIAQLNATRRTYNYTPSGLPNVDSLNSRMAVAWLFDRIFGGMSSNTFFYGMVDDGGGFMRGKALGIPGEISSGPTGTPSGSWGWDTDGSYGDWYGGHEIAHSLGRSHAEFCGAGGGVAFPYPSGRISPALTGNTAIYGFDITTRAIYPPDWRDVMTYCNNQWVSDFTYEGLRARFATLNSFALTEAQLQQGTFALVTGNAKLVPGTGQFDQINVIEGSAELPTGEGDWSIVLLSASDQELASYPFTPARVEDDDSPEEPALFAEIIPWNPATARIELRQGTTTVDTRNVSGNAPTVTITEPTGGNLTGDSVTVRWTGEDLDGDELSYTVLYSFDAGDTWRPVATDLAATELTVNLTNLPGGESSRFRVVASDGVLTGQNDSATFGLPNKAPQLTIVTPNEGATYYPAQPVALEASAYDLEDGELSGNALAWSSDKDGELGNGGLLTIDNLSTNTHVITVTATDTQSNTTSLTRTVTIASAIDVPLATELELAPGVIGVATMLAGPAETTVVSTRALGDSDQALDWAAQSSASWVTLRKGEGALADRITGSTPEDFEVVVDPTGLPIGSYNSTILVTSGQLSRTITVNMIIEGSRVYLPSVQSN